MPALVLGGLIGAAAGAGAAALSGENRRAAPDSVSLATVFGRLAVVQSSLKAGFGTGPGRGIGVTVGVRRGGLSAAAVVERAAGTQVSVSSFRAVGRLEAMHSSLRPAATVGLGRFGWTFPGPGGIRERDSYLGVDLGVGLGASLAPRLRLTADVRFHSGPGRSDGGSAGRRQMRLLSVGLDFTFGDRRGASPSSLVGDHLAMSAR